MREGPSTYTPNRWVAIRVPGKPFRIFSTWAGGYLDGDSWRLNSGVIRVEIDEAAETIDFYSESGSCVKCRFANYGIAGASNYPVLESALETLGAIDGELLPEDTDWATFNWEIE